MNPRLPRRLQIGAGFVLAGFAAGCAGITPAAQTQQRIAEKGPVFSKLTPKQQNDILGGAIERGNTPDMVYLALGKPTKIVTSADGLKAMWVYVEHYTARAPVTTSFNNPNAAHYTPGFTAINTPDLHPPPNVTFPAWLGPASFGTQGLAPVQSLDIPEMKLKTIYVFFFAGKVSEIKLDGDAFDQTTAAPNVAPPKKNSGLKPARSI